MRRLTGSGLCTLIGEIAGVIALFSADAGERAHAGCRAIGEPKSHAIGERAHYLVELAGDRFNLIPPIAVAQSLIGGRRSRSATRRRSVRRWCLLRGDRKTTAVQRNECGDCGVFVGRSPQR